MEQIHTVLPTWGRLFMQTSLSLNAQLALIIFKWQQTGSISGYNMPTVMTSHIRLLSWLSDNRL